MEHIRVLIVEDSIYSADLNVRELKKAGFTVEHQMVASEKAMMQALKEGEWDVILSDHSMPNFNALQALEVRNSIAVTTPFIIVSEGMPALDAERAMKNGCDAYVMKENLPELRQQVRLVIDMFKNNNDNECGT